MNRTLCLALASLALKLAAFSHAPVVQAQTAALPQQLSGRWLFRPNNSTQVFSLKEIAAGPDGKFAAKLTWWTFDPSCRFADVPLTGEVTATGIRFDAKTLCNVEFTAILDRSGEAWAGTATTKGNNPVVIELNAK
jgi:hypothetical protein